MGKKEINLGFHFQFLSAGKPRNGNKKVNSPGFFFCFAFRFLRNQTVGDCEAFLWLRVVLCCAWVVGKRLHGFLDISVHGRNNAALALILVTTSSFSC